MVSDLTIRDVTLGTDKLTEHYEQLIGFKIVDFMFERDEHGDDEGWPVFNLHNPKTGETVSLVLSRDPEGNGGGFGFIE